MSRSGDDSTDPAPLVQAASPVAGMFPTPSPSLQPVRASTPRIAACLSLALALLWIAGIGSLLAVVLGIVAVTSPEAGRTFRLIGASGIVLGLAGIGLATYLGFTY